VALLGIPTCLQSALASDSFIGDIHYSFVHGMDLARGNRCRRGPFGSLFPPGAIGLSGRRTDRRRLWRLSTNSGTLGRRDRSMDRDKCSLLCSTRRSLCHFELFPFVVITSCLPSGEGVKKVWGVLLRGLARGLEAGFRRGPPKL